MTYGEVANAAQDERPAVAQLRSDRRAQKARHHHHAVHQCVRSVDEVGFLSSSCSERIHLRDLRGQTQGHGCTRSGRTYRVPEARCEESTDSDDGDRPKDRVFPVLSREFCVIAGFDVLFVGRKRRGRRHVGECQARALVHTRRKSGWRRRRNERAKEQKPRDEYERFVERHPYSSSLRRTDEPGGDEHDRIQASTFPRVEKTRSAPQTSPGLSNGRDLLQCSAPHTLGRVEGRSFEGY